MASQSTPRRTRIIAQPARGHIPPLPHPSWRLAPAGSDAAQSHLASASDFWSRLGL